MANVLEPDELGKDQSNNQPGQSNQSNNNQAGQAPIQNQSQAPSITSSQVSNPNKTQGSGYTNIDKVIKANQGNQLGSSIGNNIQQVGSAAQNNLKAAQNDFNQQSAQNQFNTGTNQQLVQNVLANPVQYGSQDQTNPSAAQGKQFQNLISGQYQGPQNLANAGQIQSQAQNVGQMGQALGSAAGRIGLLQQFVGNPQYTAGQQNLDNLLLGQSHDPALQAAKRQALTLQGQTNNAISGAQAQGQQYSNQAQQFGQNVQNQLGSTVADQNTALQNQATNAQNNRNSQYQNIVKDLQSGNVTQDEANQLGLTEGQNVYNLLNDPSKFVQENPLHASASNVASSQDYARMQALQKLAGQYAPKNATQAFANYQNPSQAGTFAASPVSQGDITGFNNALNSTQSNYNSIYDPAKNQVDQAQTVKNIWDKYKGQGDNGVALARTDIANLGYGSGYLGGRDSSAQAAFADNTLATNKQKLADAQALLNQQYGTPETIHIGQGSAYPSLVHKDENDLENFPKVNG